MSSKQHTNIPGSKFLLTKGVNVELSNTCRLKCPGCGPRLFKENFKGTGIIRFNQAKVIFDTFQSVTMCGNMSDPIYHPDFLETIEYFRTSDNDVRIHTNGSGKTKEWWKEIFSASNNNIKWFFGVDGLPKDSHKYRINQNGEEVWEIMKMGSSMGANITWQYIVFNYNENDIETCKDMAKTHNMNFIEVHSTRWDLHPDLKPNDLNKTMKRRKEMSKELQSNRIELDPECLSLDIAKDIMFTNKGYFLPCCECDGILNHMEFNNIGFFNKEFHIDNLKTPNDIIKMFDSNIWKDFHSTLLLTPELAPTECQRFCRKLPDSTKQHGRGLDGFAH